jgi:hypothetical protein
MMESWILQARERVAKARGQVGWGYRPGAELAVEPSVIAGLALLGTDEDAASSRAIAAATGAALARLQQPDGHVGPSASQSSPGWPTPFALLLWTALDAEAPARKRAVAYLLGLRGEAFPKRAGSPFGHDTTLQGWPWVEGTHSWVEPTALAILALCREGRRSQPRVEEGLKLLRDRALPSGGWNYGNTTVFGAELRPQPGPTGLALLALAATGTRAPCVERGLAYLEKTLPALRAPQSLGLGLLGLRAHGRDPATVRAAFEAALAATAAAPDAAVQAAYLLLGAGGRSLELLGAGRRS